MYPDLFKNTPYQIATWDLFLLIGFIFVIVLAAIKKPRDFPLNRLTIIILPVLLLICGFFGAKLLYIYLHRKTIFVVTRSTLAEAFPSAGYAFLGGLFAEIAALAAFVKIRIKRISFLVFADYAVPFLILHEAIVRIGCFFAGCCYGKPTDLPWACVFLKDNIRRHPTQLYESLILAITYFSMRHIYKKGAPKGVVFFGTIGMYTFLRFFVEYFRADSFPVIGDITLAQVTVFAIATVCAIALLIILKRGKR